MALIASELGESLIQFVGDTLVLLLLLDEFICELNEKKNVSHHLKYRMWKFYTLEYF